MGGGWGGGGGGGEKIKALTETEAMQWIEDRDINPDDVIGIFEFDTA